MSREPVVIAQLIQTSLIALLGVLGAFDVWSPTPEQIGALTMLYVALAGAVTYILRGVVYAPASVIDVEIEQDEELPHALQRAMNREP